MKNCPQCKRTYSDETLSFCLEDGALLSAPYNPQETNAPTFILNAVEIPTVVAREIPPVISDFNEVPTIVAASHITEQKKIQPVQTTVYLIGLAFSIILYFALNPLDTALNDIFINIFNLRNSNSGNIVEKILLVETLTNLLIYGILGLIFGFIKPEVKWIWGLVIIIPHFIKYTYGWLDYIIDSERNFSSRMIPYLLLSIFALLVTISFACFCSHTGSRLSQKIFNKLTT